MQTTTILRESFALPYFGKAALQYHWTKAKSNFVVVVGENASGKSLLRRILGTIARKGMEVLSVSVEGRSGGGFAKAFVYGSEEWKATGANSAVTVLTGIKTCQSRQRPHIIIWDEPDLGLSEAWSRSMGQTLCHFVKNLPENTKTVVVISHSKVLLNEFVDIPHHFVCMGTTTITDLKSYLEHQPEVRPLEVLLSESHRTFQSVQKIREKREKSLQKRK